LPQRSQELNGEIEGLNAEIAEIVEFPWTEREPSAISAISAF
jgi:hypothetical protein